MYKVRFHLGRGEHYRHWQITGNGLVQYYDPEIYSLFLSECTLISQPKAAQRVHDSGKKDVCGWVLCETWTASNVRDNEWVRELIDEEYPIDNLARVWYNPIVDTEWHMQGVEESVTDAFFSCLVTKGNRVYYDLG